MAAVTVKQWVMVKPAEATPPGHLSLSEWDLSGCLYHFPTLYFYHPRPPTAAMFDALRDSLGRALVHFYPLAGRLRPTGGGRFQVACNALGAQLVEAESEGALSDLGDFSPSPALDQLLPQVDAADPIHEVPLLLAQLTTFRCGSFCLGVSLSHIVADGRSAFHFLQEWGRLARGLPIGTPPVFDRRVIMEMEPPPAAPPVRCAPTEVEFYEPPRLLGQTDSLMESKKKTSITVLRLTQTQAKKLRVVANQGRGHAGAGDPRPYSLYETVTAHVWRCFCRARRHEHAQPTGLIVTVDFRDRVQPPLPRGYSGNAVADVFATALSGELTGRSLGHAAGRVRETIDAVDHAFVWSTTERLRRRPDVADFENRFYGRGSRRFLGNPNQWVISWLRLPLYGMDFGWGEEFHMCAAGSHEVDGGVMILPGREGDGSLAVVACLHLVHMESFKRIFYEDIGSGQNSRM